MFVPIANQPRDYAWGSTALLADYLGRTPSGGPEAELWLGAHPACPASVTAGAHAGRTLDAALAATGDEPPKILLKVLAADAPLSLQVHPDAEQARAGFEREERAGIPREAPHRTYRDAHPKPELIVAVSPFEALSGFRPREAALAVVEALAAQDARLGALVPHVRDGDALEWLLSDDPAVAEAVAAAPAAGRAIAEDFPADADTIARLHRARPGDRGVLIALLLHRVSLAPGEAISLPAGNLHAYLSGLGIELMSASDNVLRCALTSKHIDAAELLRIVDKRPLADPRLRPEPMPGGLAYRPEAPFELRSIRGEHRFAGGRGLLLAVSPARVMAGAATHALRPGEGMWIDSQEACVIVSDDAWLGVERDTPDIPVPSLAGTTLLESST